MADHHSYKVPRMSEQVARKIVDYISFENLQPGTKLPTERKLSQLLEVSRSSVREGLRVLEILGYVHSRQGYGTFVSASVPFLIPQQVLQHKPNPNQLDHYFESAMMVAEKIMALSRKQETTESATESITNFTKELAPEISQKSVAYEKGIRDWDSFSKWVISLGDSLDNPHYKALWESIYQFLCEHDYFKRRI